LIGVVSLLCVVTLGFLITRVATVALRATGMSAAPTGMTPIRLGDTVVVYGRTSALNELRDRRAGVAGDRAHEDAKAEHERIVAQEAIEDGRTAAPQRQQHLRGG
jgi:uncharacterized transporter YbjL